jgi:type IV pilus assembly protein PilC
VKAAMTYPTVVFVMAVLMCIAMLLFIVPVFANMFSELGGTLPLPTRVLMGMSDGLKQFFPLLIVLAIAAAVAGARPSAPTGCATRSTRSS